MGGGGSSTIKQELNMSVVNDILYESVTNNESINENTMQNIQNMSLEIGRNIGCNIETDQTINSSFMATTQQITESFQTVSNELVSELQAQAGAALDKQSQMGNFQFGDRQNVDQKINTEIENIVKTMMETNNLTKTINKAVNVQGQNIKIGETICLDGEQLSFRQNISADLAAQAVAKNILSAATSNKIVNEVISEAEASASTEAGGAAEVIEEAGEAVSGVVGAVTGPMKYAILSIAAICLLLIGAMLYLGLSPAGQNKIRNANMRGMKMPGGFPGMKR
jgi:Zn finger protein HypA/HybF involved in hydrogenase expression